MSGSTLFKGADNTSILKQVRTLFAAREFILSDSADRWTQVVDNSNAAGGAWAMTGYSHGGYDNFSLNQSGLNVGVRQPAAGNAWWGMGAEFYRGTAARMTTGMISACGEYMPWPVNRLPVVCLWTVWPDTRSCLKITPFRER